MLSSWPKAPTFGWLHQKPKTFHEMKELVMVFFEYQPQA